MKEDFLHYLWKFQKFSKIDLFTVSGDILCILNVGTHNLNAGPDFLMAQVEIGGQRWVGNVELHLKSSDWYNHKHDSDPKYDNVILHVVWKHDTEIIRKDHTLIPTLTLMDRVPDRMIERYDKLFNIPRGFISCGDHFSQVEGFLLNSWLWRMYIERLQQKSEWILEQLKSSNQNWEAVWFRLLCRTFGLKVNGDSFYSIATSVDYSIVKKCGKNVQRFEALLFGQAGFLELDVDDTYLQELRLQYAHIQALYGISKEGVHLPDFFRLRPANFPTIRLAQFAALWIYHPRMLSELLEANSKEKIYRIFQIAPNEYWDTHYNFGVTSTLKRKSLTKRFMDLLIINALIPMKFTYGSYYGKDSIEEVTDLALSVSGENNTVVQSFQKLRIMENSAWHSQALLHLKKEYCENFKCMNCEVGNAILSAVNNKLSMRSEIFEQKNG